MSTSDSRPLVTPTLANGPRRRTQAREAALALLYEWDLTGARPGDLDLRLAEMLSDPQGREFARALFEGVAAHKDAIDAKIHDTALHWRLSRMAFVDRNVLRLGLFELAFSDQTHPTVVINEAIELAKRFSTEHSGAFVNGILDRIRLSLAPPPDEGEESPADAPKAP